MDERFIGPIYRQRCPDGTGCFPCPDPACPRSPPSEVWVEAGTPPIFSPDGELLRSAHDIRWMRVLHPTNNGIAIWGWWPEEELTP